MLPHTATGVALCCNAFVVCACAHISFCTWRQELGESFHAFIPLLRPRERIAKFVEARVGLRRAQPVEVPVVYEQLAHVAVSE